MGKIIFNSLDLFPLLLASPSYNEAQEHSVLVDEYLGFETAAIESTLLSSYGQKNLQSEMQAWIGLPVQAMQTPYTEIREVLSVLSPGEGSTIVDLGCAYGRMAFVVGHHFPHVHFIGYELIEERVHEAQRVLQKFNYPHCRIEAADLSRPDFTPPPAEYYFIFDFGNRPSVEKVLEDLKKISRLRPIVVVARGRGIRHWIYQGHPWLYAIVEPQVFDHFTVFRTETVRPTI